MSDCAVCDCDRPAARAGYCHTHSKRLARGMPVDVPVPQRPKSPFERATEAALAYASAEDEADFKRARDNLRKSIVACAPVIRGEEISELTRAALELRKAAGVKLGRPSKVHPALAEAKVLEAGSVARAARELHVSVSALFRTLRRKRESHP